jgi:hypothetical protein
MRENTKAVKKPEAAREIARTLVRFAAGHAVPGGRGNRRNPLQL